MKSLTLFFLLLFSNAIYAQTVIYSQKEWDHFDDSLISLVNKSTFNMDSMAFLMIYSHEADNYNAKGFIVGNNTGDDIPIETCGNKLNERFSAEHIRENIYLIKYKWQYSKQFEVDTFFVFCFEGTRYMAYSTRYNHDEYKMLKNSAFSWSFGPASSDEREVVYICPRKNEIILYSR